MIFIVLSIVVGLGAVALIGHLRGEGTPDSSSESSSSWFQHLFSGKPTTERRVTSFNNPSSWTPKEELQLESQGPYGFRRIALGHPNLNGQVDSSVVVYSNGDTPVGIMCGGTGSGKSTTILAEAALMHGRDEDGQILNGGAPLLDAAPKTELTEWILAGRQRQGRVVIWAPDGPTLAIIPNYLKPLVGKWNPLCACTDWDWTQSMAEAMCSGVAGEGVSNGSFWENSAARAVAAAMWAVRWRGPGGTMCDVYDALTMPRENRNPETGKVTHIPPLVALHAEIERKLTLPPGITLTPLLQQRTAEAGIAMRAIADLAISEAGQTNSSIVTTAITSLSSVLRAGTLEVAWDDPGAINIKELLVDSAGTISVVGTFEGMRSTRPLTSAFLTAVKRTLEYAALARPRGRLERQCLVIVDELPVVVGNGEMFGEWCASARSQGVQLLWATQDLSSLDHYWGENIRNRTVSNTTDRLTFANTGDVKSLELAEALAGDHKVITKSSSTQKGSGRSSGESDSTSSNRSKSDSFSEEWRPMAPKGRLAAMRPGEALLIGSATRVQLATRPYWTKPMLMNLVEHGTPEGPAPIPEPPAWAMNLPGSTA